MNLAPLVAFLLVLAGSGWKDDTVWYDGQAEKCVYVATRSIYGVPREYTAIAYTNKERADETTTTKSDSGIEVFKHHWSERVPTERYDYDFSTMTYTRTSDLSAFKLTVATQEDCGASFKEAWRTVDGLNWFESIYFPGDGRHEGQLDAGPELRFADALSLTLRDFPFEEPETLQLALLPSQKSTRRVPFVAVRRSVKYAGAEELELPIGKLDAHRLDLLTPDGRLESSFWFAAEAKAPWLHALLRYEGPDGITYRLKSFERTAYWKR